MIVELRRSDKAPWLWDCRGDTEHFSLSSYWFFAFQILEVSKVFTFFFCSSVNEHQFQLSSFMKNVLVKQLKKNRLVCLRDSTNYNHSRRIQQSHNWDYQFISLADVGAIENYDQKPCFRVVSSRAHSGCKNRQVNQRLSVDRSKSRKISEWWCCQKGLVRKILWLFETARFHRSFDACEVRVAVGLGKTHIGQPNPPHWWGWTPYFVQWVGLGW
jgi:hypothetical protein